MTSTPPDPSSTPRAPKPPRWSRFAFWGVLILLMLGSVVTYRGVLDQPLESDARFLSTQNNIVTDGSPSEFFTRDFFEGADTRGFIYLSGYYRPVTNTVFWLQHRLWGDRAAFYNLSGMLLHGLNAALLALLVAGVGRSRLAGLLAGALWVVHPVHAFAVTEPAALGDLMATGFYLAALLAFARGIGFQLPVPGGTAGEPHPGAESENGSDAHSSRGITVGRRWIASSTGLFLLAVLSKESGITFPAAAVALALLAGFRDSRPLGPALKATLPLWGVFVGYLGWRFGILSIFPGTVGYAEDVGTIALSVGVMKTVVVHLARIVLPMGWEFPEMHPWMVATANASPADPLTLVAVMVVLGGGALALLWRDKPELAFWASLFWITYSPLARVDNIGGAIGTTTLLAQERWIYLPAIAVIGGGAVLLARLLTGQGRALEGAGAAAVSDSPITPADTPAPDLGVRRRLIPIAAVLAIAALSWTASTHARVQRDQLAQLAMLYEIPDEALGRVGMANRLMYYAYRVALPQGDLPEAVARAEAAVELVPDSPIFPRALAGLRGAQGDWEGARALVLPWIDPDSSFLAEQSTTNYRVYDDLNRVAGELWLVLGEAEGNLGDPAASETAFCGALQRNHRTDLLAQAVERTPGVTLPLTCDRR